MHSRAVLTFCAGLLALPAARGGDVPSTVDSQVTPYASPPPGMAGRSSEFLAAETVELHEVAGGAYDRRAVRVKGEFRSLETRVNAQFFELSDRGVVVIIPVPELLNDVPSLLGKRVEVVGFVRRLKERQEMLTCVGRVPRPESYCQDPSLPPTPDLQGDGASWPRVSITIWSISDVSPLSFKKGETDRLSDALGTLEGERREVRVKGRFCGVTLCGPAPGPAPQPSAWLLKDGEDFVWVVGKEPRGKGWRLDPSYAADSRRWLEVAGRVERCGAALCLRANKVSLTLSPDAAETEVR